MINTMERPPPITRLILNTAEMRGIMVFKHRCQLLRGMIIRNLASPTAAHPRAVGFLQIHTACHDHFGP